MIVKTLIIDDEQPARDLIRTYLEPFKEIEIVKECENGFEGLKAIQEYQPKLIFLDVQMPKVTGFEMLELLDEIPVVIFSTAYDQFAIKAFELNAADYLLKPYDENRFAQAVKRALERITDNDKKTVSVREIIDHHQEESGPLDRIVVKTGNKIKVIPIEKVEYIEAYDDYVNIFTSDGRFLKNQTMGFYEKNLNPKEFARVHRSHIVKINQIVQIEPYEKETKVLKMKSGTTIKVSRNGLKVLKEKLGL